MNQTISFNTIQQTNRLRLLSCSGGQAEDSANGGLPLNLSLQDYGCILDGSSEHSKDDLISLVTKQRTIKYFNTILKMAKVKPEKFTNFVQSCIPTVSLNEFNALKLSDKLNFVFEYFNWDLSLVKANLDKFSSVKLSDFYGVKASLYFHGQEIYFDALPWFLSDDVPYKFKAAVLHNFPTRELSSKILIFNSFAGRQSDIENIQNLFFNTNILNNPSSSCTIILDRQLFSTINIIVSPFAEVAC